MNDLEMEALALTVICPICGQPREARCVLPGGEQVIPHLIRWVAAEAAEDEDRSYAEYLKREWLRHLESCKEDSARGTTPV